MRCPSCQTEYTGGRFCITCGSPLRGNPTVRFRTEGPQEEVTRSTEAPESSVFRSQNEADWGYSWDVSSAIESAIERLRTMFHSLKNQNETTDDLTHGQVVIIAARWILVVAGLMLALWNADSMAELQTSIVLILGLAAANFFLHSHVLMGRPLSSAVVYAASAADIAVISLVLIVSGGFDTSPYVFYFPAILALSVAFETRVTIAFTGAAIAIYGIVSAFTASGAEGALVITHMLMLAAVATCGNVYWRIERGRRSTAAVTGETVEDQMRHSAPVH